MSTAMDFLTEPQRNAVLTKTLHFVGKKFVAPKQPSPDIDKLRASHQDEILRSSSPEEFEQAVNRMLQTLGTSHTGFFHESRPRAAGRIAIAATLTKRDTPDGPRWVFQDVHAGGVAAAAGIRPGDVLLAVGDQELIPPAATPFRLGETYTLTVRRTDGSTVRPTLQIPGSKEKRRPIVVPDQVVTASKLGAD